MRRRVQVGEEFEGDIELITGDAEVRRIETASRAVVVVFALVVGSILLFGAAGYGVMDKDFSVLAALWSIEGPVFGAIVGHYLK